MRVFLDESLLQCGVSREGSYRGAATFPRRARRVLHQPSESARTETGADVIRHTTGGGWALTHAVGSRCVRLLPTTLFLLPATPETSFSCRNFFVVAPPVKTAEEEEDRTLSHHTATPLLTATAGTPVSGHVGGASGPFRRLSACRRSPPVCLRRRLNTDAGGTLRPISRLENTKNWSWDENRQKVLGFFFGCSRVDAETEIKRRLRDSKRRSLENLDHDKNTNAEQKWNQTQGAVEVGCT